MYTMKYTFVYYPGRIFYVIIFKVYSFEGAGGERAPGFSKKRGNHNEKKNDETDPSGTGGTDSVWYEYYRGGQTFADDYKVENADNISIGTSAEASGGTQFTSVAVGKNSDAASEGSVVIGDGAKAGMFESDAINLIEGKSGYNSSKNLNYYYKKIGSAAPAGWDSSGSS